jgi:RimJ/RimL family protein N-acetyltransferase
MNAGHEPVLEIYTQRLRLRLPQLDDADAVSRQMRPEISLRLASWPEHLTPAAAAARLAEARAAALAGKATPLLIERRSNGEVVGWIGATLAEGEAKRGVLTYWLGLQHQGEGLMREAAPAALAAAFTHLDVPEMRAAVHSDNPISRAVLQGIGMKMLGIGRIWCSARGREEQCEWWAVARSPAAETAAATAGEGSGAGLLPLSTESAPAWPG